ncbi:MAG TPA: universal stress protein [Pirellulales bacterium]|nr:universal stress protein [Pirellulales bacterium]
MAHFRSILVGVDPLQAEQLWTTNFTAAAAGAVHLGIRVAAKGPSGLTFLSIVDVPEADKYFLEPDRRGVVEHVERSAERVLGELVPLAGAQGVNAEWELKHGTAWKQIIGRVARCEHDLVIVARSCHDYAWRDLLGHTAVKLVHYCPCPVWVAKPEMDQAELNILVASDLSEVGERALEIAVTLRTLLGGKIHLLHVLESPFARLSSSGLVQASAGRFFRDARAGAQRALAAHIARTGDSQAAGEIDVQVINGGCDSVVLEFIQTHKINLLVMGTAARGGLSRIMLGNTAERLLPYVHCSLLIVKPEGFKLPVQLDHELHPAQVHL